jgi:hypothetical protein
MFSVSHMPPRQIGTFTKKMLRQSNTASSSPPMSGPRTCATPPALAQDAIAFARVVSSLYACLISDSALGTSSDAPTPCNIRPAMSTDNDGAQPLISDAAVKSTSPIM